MKLALLNCNQQTGVRPGNTSLAAIKALRERGLFPDVEVWQFIHPALPHDDRPLGVPTKTFDLDDEMRSQDLLPYVAQRGQPDVLWVDGRFAKPHVVQALDCCPDSYKLVWGADRTDKVECMERYDLCLVDEPKLVAKVEKRAPNVRAAVCDKFVDESVFFQYPAEKRYDIVCTAYMTKRKKHEVLFRAMAQLKDRNLTCVVLGDDHRGGAPVPERVEYSKYIHNLVDELGVSVDFAGALEHSEVNRYLNESRIGVLPSRKDGAPRAVIEYMAVGLPVLVSSELLAGQRYVAPEVGLIRPPDEFHLGIAELLDHPERFHPRDYYLEHFSRDKVTDSTAELLREAGCPLG